MTVTPVFILSLPRSGSTLLQRLLADHPHVSTTPEPWLLLPLLAADNPGSGASEYGFDVALRARQEFWSALPGGRDRYLRAVGDLARTLYTEASADGATHFVDKTPRNHLVLEDLYKAFPGAKFVVLWRNPLDNLASILDLDGHWNLYRYEVDLFAGWKSIYDFQASHPEVLAVRYEELVQDPQAVMAVVLDHLGLPLRPVQLSDDGNLVTARMGDKRGIARYDGVSGASVERWHDALGTTMRRRYAVRYLDHLGAAPLHALGYDYASMRRSLLAGSTRWHWDDMRWRGWGLAYRHLNAGTVKRRWARRGTRTEWGYE